MGNTVSGYAASGTATGGYAPVRGSCPSQGSLIRPASGINPSEAAFVAQRYPQASKSLESWLHKIDTSFPVLESAQYPLLGLVNGGGGLRGYTLSAGVHKAFDGDEPDAASYSTSGLYQAFTYESALSGTALMLYSYVANEWPLTSTLLSELWVPAFEAGISNPPDAVVNNQIIGGEVLSKFTAGFVTSIIDLWGRILSYSTFLGSNPGLTTTVSGFTSLSGYTNHQHPYPIITAIGVENDADACGLPPPNATQYEFTPNEFGSWESGIASFMQMEYLGTTMSNGAPVGSVCVTAYDNAGWAAGVSSGTFNEACGVIDGFYSREAGAAIGEIYKEYLGGSQTSNYGLVPNPFQGLDGAPRVANEVELSLVDGGETIQVSPIWPFLYRPDVDVLVLSDNGADNPTNYQTEYPNDAFINLPSGEQIFHVYEQAMNSGISNRMPPIPSTDDLMARNLNKQAMTFFGCAEPASSSALFLVYLPNRPIVVDSNVDASVTKYNASFTGDMIANGEAMATNDGDPRFATCMACGVMKMAAARAGKALPAACAACFESYCA